MALLKRRLVLIGEQCLLNQQGFVVADQWENPVGSDVVKMRLRIRLPVERETYASAPYVRGMRAWPTGLGLGKLSFLKDFDCDRDPAPGLRLAQDILYGLMDLIWWRSRLPEFGSRPDHVHLLTDIHPALDISVLINNLKTASARSTRNRFAEHLAAFTREPPAGTGRISPTVWGQRLKRCAPPWMRKGHKNMRANPRQKAKSSA